jgi:hypothetical protein
MKPTAPTLDMCNDNWVGACKVCAIDDVVIRGEQQAAAL